MSDLVKFRYEEVTSNTKKRDKETQHIKERLRDITELEYSLNQSSRTRY